MGYGAGGVTGPGGADAAAAARQAMASMVMPLRQFQHFAEARRRDDASLLEDRQGPATDHRDVAARRNNDDESPSRAVPSPHLRRTFFVPSPYLRRFAVPSPRLVEVAGIVGAAYEPRASGGGGGAAAAASPAAAAAERQRQRRRAAARDAGTGESENAALAYFFGEAG